MADVLLPTPRLTHKRLVDMGDGTHAEVVAATLVGASESYSASEVLDATIAAGASLSGGLNLGGLRLFGIVMPAAWTAASLTFQASVDGGTSWHNVKDATGTEISVVATADDCVVWLPAAFSALTMLKVRSGTAAAPVAQGAERVITLILRSV